MTALYWKEKAEVDNKGIRDLEVLWNKRVPRKLKAVGEWGVMSSLPTVVKSKRATQSLEAASGSDMSSQETQSELSEESPSTRKAKKASIMGKCYIP